MGCYLFLGIVKDAMNTCVQDYVFIFLKQVPRSGFIGSYSKYVFKFVINYQIIFQSDNAMIFVS